VRALLHSVVARELMPIQWHSRGEWCEEGFVFVSFVLQPPLGDERFNCNQSAQAHDAIP
jgi:hypothetical protein